MFGDISRLASSAVLGMALSMAGTAWSQLSVSDGFPRGNCQSMSIVTGAFLLGTSLNLSQGQLKFLPATGCLGVSSQGSAGTLITVADGLFRGNCSSVEISGGNGTIGGEVALTSGAVRFRPDGCLAQSAISGSDPTFTVRMVPTTVSQPAPAEGVISARVYVDAAGTVPPNTQYSLNLNVCRTADGCDPNSGIFYFLPYAGIGGTGINAAAPVTSKTFPFVFQPGRDVPASEPNPLQTMLVGQVNILTSPIISVEKVVKIGVSGPTATAAASSLAIAPGATSGTVGLDGQPINGMTASQMVPGGGQNICYTNGGPSRGSNPNTGPCNSSPVAVANCGSGMGGAITGAWQMNLDGYPDHRFQTLHMPIPKGNAFSFKFRTPTQAFVNTLGSDFGAGFSKADTSVWPTRSLYMTVTPNRCDFDYVKNDLPHGCYKGWSGGDQSVTIRLLRTGSTSQPSPTICDLSPDTEYFVNFRWEHPGSPPYATTTGNRGIESCDFSTCGFVIRFD